MFRLLFFAAALSALVRCTGQNKSIATKPVQDNKENPYQLLGNDLDSIANASGKFELFVQKHKLTDRFPVLKAVVIETSSGKVMAQFSFTPGYIKWISEDEVEIYNAPGMMKKDEDISKFIRQVKIKTSSHNP
ncbi:MAG: hypothetical protein HOP30_04375 [Cyclobacteriaceae bacterium]|nr:hypothetical protein [Cyclobacteriaceae bacterium]